MNSFIKYVLIIGVAVGAGYAISNLKSLAAQFSYRIVGYGKPSFSNWLLTIPIVVEFNNPTPLPLNIDRIIADLYIDKSGQWAPAARVDQPISIAAGVSRQTINAVGNISSIFGGNIIATLNALSSALNNKLKIKVDVVAVYGSVTLPTQTYYETIALV